MRPAGRDYRRVSGDREDPLSESTLQPVDPTSRHSRATVPCLTILSHPELGRIGERALLPALLVRKTVSVSRGLCDFAPVTGGAAHTLADRYLTRRPLKLSSGRAEGAIRVDATEHPITANGTPLSGALEFDRRQVEHGVVLRLSPRVVLLLHRSLGIPPREGNPILGQSDALSTLMAEIDRACVRDQSTLIRGETGVGKELVARAIHDGSHRKRGPFVAVNMATLTPSTAVSTLFGHARGAYTGAATSHRGLFSRADGGTLFLDEIAEAPESVQPMLLRALETASIAPLGEGRERQVDVRVLAATDADLADLLTSGSFRGALYHRLAGLEIRVPSLRERRDDIMVLFTRFVLDRWSEHMQSDPGEEGILFDASLVEQLVSDTLPGNVRQLRNLALRAAAIARPGEPLALRPEWLDTAHAAPRAIRATDSARAPHPVDVPDEATLTHALAEHDWSPDRAARALGLSSSTVHYLMRKSDQIRRAADIPSEELRAALVEHDGDTRAAAGALRVSTRALNMTLRQRGLLED